MDQWIRFNQNTKTGASGRGSRVGQGAATGMARLCTAWNHAGDRARHACARHSTRHSRPVTCTRRMRHTAHSTDQHTPVPDRGEALELAALDRVLQPAAAHKTCAARGTVHAGRCTWDVRGAAGAVIGRGHRARTNQPTNQPAMRATQPQQPQVHGSLALQQLDRCVMITVDADAPLPVGRLAAFQWVVVGSCRPVPVDRTPVLWPGSRQYASGVVTGLLPFKLDRAALESI